MDECYFSINWVTTFAFVDYFWFFCCIKRRGWVWRIMMMLLISYSGCGDGKPVKEGWGF